MSRRTTYTIKYGKGDRLKEDGTPLNLIQIVCQGKAVDLIVTDWFWVSRQRSE